MRQKIDIISDVQVIELYAVTPSFHVFKIVRNIFQNEYCWSILLRNRIDSEGAYPHFENVKVRTAVLARVHVTPSSGGNLEVQFLFLRFKTIYGYFHLATYK